MKTEKEISIKKAAIINAVAKYSRVLMNIAFTMVLARLLSPGEFGVIAVINVFTNLFMMFTDMGIGASIIQNKCLDERDLSSIYSFSICVGFVLFIAFGFLSYTLSFFYENNAYKGLGWVLSFSLLFNTLNTVPNALLMKQKKFTIIARRTVITYFFSCVVGVVLALYGWSFYAVAMQAVIYALGAYIWNV